MSVKHVLLLWLLLGALSLGTCLSEGSLGPAARDLAEDCVTPARPAQRASELPRAIPIMAIRANQLLNREHA